MELLASFVQFLHQEAALLLHFGMGALHEMVESLSLDPQHWHSVERLVWCLSVRVFRDNQFVQCWTMSFAFLNSCAMGLPVHHAVEC